VTNAPRQGRGEFLQPLPGCVSLLLFYPGVRFAHPRLSSFRPAGADFGTAEVVPSRLWPWMNTNLTILWTLFAAIGYSEWVSYRREPPMHAD